MRILLVEDEEGIGRFVRQGLQEALHVVDWARNAADGLSFALSQDYDVLVLDIRLPGGRTGLDLLADLRARQVRTPVLMLTALDAVDDRVRGLRAGADDYLVKPFDFAELLARLESLARRPPLQVNTVLRIADLEMDLVKRTVRRRDRLIDLSAREFMLLEYLMRNAHQTLTRTQIGERVWGLDYAHDSKVIDVYVGYLRRKIEQDDSPPLIHTVRGVGFRLSDDE
ncbi:response regulator transcription factor [Aggregatilineales bacterium SYSU G02658]